MKRILLVLLFIVAFSFVNAQFKSIAEGPAFKEPVSGFAKILQMKNGNTMFICITVKKGIDVRIYDAAHKETVVTNFEPDYGKLKGGKIEGVFEINGDAVLMLSLMDSSTPILYRLIVDGKTGNLKEQVQLAQLDKVTFGDRFAMTYGNVPMPNFFVRKDPNSDNYALVMFNTFESERSKRIEIVTYGPDNKEASRAYYASPNEKYKYLRYVDMAVLGNTKVCVLAYGYNTAHSGGKESELILANLDKRAKSVSFTELGFTKDMVVDAGVVRYNPVIKSLILVADVKSEHKENEYAPVIAIVDPFEKKILRVDVLSPSDRINKYSKDGFTGLPENLFINDNGTFTVVSEEVTVRTRSSQYGTDINTELGDMAIVNYSKTGELIDDYIVRKSQILDNFALGLFYHSHRQGTAQMLENGTQYKSFAYLDGKNQSYILFNDTERNNDAQESGSLVTIRGVSGSDGFYYPIKGENPVPKRAYVFGQPAEKRDHNLGLFAISDYDRNTNVYTTLKLSKESGKKEVQIVWLQPN